jgi:hypothetical protein
VTRGIGTHSQIARYPWQVVDAERLLSAAAKPD